MSTSEATRDRYDVRNEGTSWAPLYVVEFEGQRIEATNPFLLDSRLSDAGAPPSRDLYLIGEDDD